MSYLTEELVMLGHDVTLFASWDFITSAELAPCCTRALPLDPTVRETIPRFMVMIDKVRERAGIPGVILSVPMLAIAKIICDRLTPLAAFGHFLEG